METAHNKKCNPYVGEEASFEQIMGEDPLIPNLDQPADGSFKQEESSSLDEPSVEQILGQEFRTQMTTH